MVRSNAYINQAKKKLYSLTESDEKLIQMVTW